MAKAEKSLGETLVEVTKYSKVYSSGDMMRVIALIEMDSDICTRDESTSLAAALISKCRANALAGGPFGESDFKLYAVGIAEAFRKFPASVGYQAVNGGTGLPATLAFWPRPFDIVTFCEQIIGRRRTAKAMAQRHLAEAKRRKEEPEWKPPTLEEKARVAAKLAEFKRAVAEFELKDMRRIA